MEDYVKDLERQLANKDIENMKLKDKVECLEDKIDYAINYIEQTLELHKKIQNRLIVNNCIPIGYVEEILNILKGE